MNDTTQGSCLWNPLSCYVHTLIPSADLLTVLDERAEPLSEPINALSDTQDHFIQHEPDHLTYPPLLVRDARAGIDLGCYTRCLGRLLESIPVGDIDDGLTFVFRGGKVLGSMRESDAVGFC